MLLKLDHQETEQEDVLPDILEVHLHMMIILDIEVDHPEPEGGVLLTHIFLLMIEAPLHVDSITEE